MNKKKFSTKFLVEMALLVAIILIMAFTPLGYIKTAGIEITLIVVPVAVGAVTLGPAAGAILGGVFGLASFLRCFGLNAFGAMLLSINPFLNTTFFMGMLVIGFYNTEYIQSFVSALGAKNALLFILAFVGVNGLVEAIVCFVVGTAISAALKKALKYN